MTHPLEGVRVLDLSRMLTGGFATMVLGDLGAEVIKVEAIDGDPLRKMPPHFRGDDSAYFLSISRNKKSLTLDLKKTKGRKIFCDLVKNSDVVFDNFRNGVLSRLGIDHEQLGKINPKIVCCSISAYGKSGPLRDAPGFDLVIQALSGIMSYTGEPGRDPVRMGAPMGDLGGSLYAVIAILSALISREKTGKGCTIDLSLLDCLVSLNTYVSQYYWLGGEVPGPLGSGHQSVVPYRSYRTRDGHYTVAVFVEKFWQGLCNAIGRPELGDDDRYNSTAKRLENRGEVDLLLEQAFAEKTGEEWAACLQRENVPGAPVLSIAEALSHEQLLERQMIVDLPLDAGESMKMIGDPIKRSGFDTSPLVAAPGLGENTREILGDLLGMDDDQVEQLMKEQIVSETK